MSIVGSAGSGLGGAGDIGGALGSFYSQTIDQSLRFEDGDSAHLSRNPDANSSNGRNLNTTSFWVKRGNLGSTQMMYAVGSSFPSNHNDSSIIQFLSDDTLRYRTESAGSATSQLDTTRVFRDVSSWYHIHLIFDRDNSTEADRLKLYINGVRETVFDTANYPTTSQNSQFTNNKLTYIGRSTANYFDGYIAEFVSIDSAAVSHDSFGELKDGIWIPKDISSGLTYGDNGFRLTFEATGTATTAQDTTAQTNIGDDQSGLGNNFAVSGLVASDVVPDSPTNNFAVLNTLYNNASSGVTYSEGNLKIATTNTGYYATATNFIPNTGKWYAEFHAGDANPLIGITRGTGVKATSSLYITTGSTNHVAYYGNNGYLYNNGTNQLTADSGKTMSAGDIIGVTIDYEAGEAKWYKNNSLMYTASSLTLTDITFAVSDLSNSLSTTVIANFGQDSSFAGNKTSGSAAASDANGQGDFFYTPPSGFLAMCSSNLSEPAIIDASEYFNTVLYTGNSGTQSITGVGFQPDWVWGKNRGNTYNHVMYDSVRGVENRLEITATSTETVKDDGVTAFGTDGFSVGDDGALNENAKGIVAWNWKAGTAFSNDASATSVGTIDSAGRVDTTAGFSIIGYSGTSSAGTIAHGLGKVPSMYIVKSRTNGTFWAVYHSDLTGHATTYLDLDNSVKEQTGQTHWNSTAPTNEVFSVNTQGSVNDSSHTYIAYCFADIEGYSSAGVYKGNGNANGTYVHTGFRPAWILVKRSDSNTGSYWWIHDNKRNTTANGNDTDATLHANANTAESGLIDCETDFLSNGFKIRNTANQANNSSGTYIYLAFAEQPFKYANAK